MELLIQKNVKAFRIVRLGTILFLLVCFSSASAFAEPTTQTANPLERGSNSPSIEIEIIARQTCEGIGACQGVACHDGFVYLYGDLYQRFPQSGPGVIRQYIFESDMQNSPCLKYTGLEITLVRRGENLINHPTGLTWNSIHGTYLGNTITKTKKGTIFRLDWPQMIIDRNLDNAILQVTDDDLAIQGCRPEFVMWKGKWLLATADYGQVRNAIRLYDPHKLRNAAATSGPAILVESFPCTPWVQQLHWVDTRGMLLLAQNQIEGRRWRLTPVFLQDGSGKDDSQSILPNDKINDATELEGVAMVDDDIYVFVSSARKENVSFARLSLGDRGQISNKLPDSPGR